MVDFRRTKRAPRLDLNPSAADRWTTCTASPHFILENWDKVQSDETKFNQEGTTAHEVAAAYLQDRQPDEKDKYRCPVPVDADMRWHGWEYMEYVRGLLEPGGKLLVEQKLPLWYMPDRNAMVDAAIINHDSIHIIDYKYGEGMIVSPVGSLQATIYAAIIGLFGKFSVPLDDEFPVTVHIYQPRGRAAEDGASHIWETNWAGIQTLVRYITVAAEIIQRNRKGDLQIEFAPSEKACQWCPAKGFCGARQQYLTRDIETLAVIPSGDKHFPPVKAVSLDELAAILKHKSQIEKWLKDAEAYAHQFLSAGHKIPGFKLVTSRGGNRYWSDPKQAEKLLLQTHLREDEVIEKKVIGVAGAEELLGKNKFSVELTKLIARPPGKPVIAPEDDKRENCLLTAENEFQDV